MQCAAQYMLVSISVKDTHRGNKLSQSRTAFIGNVGKSLQQILNGGAVRILGQRPCFLCILL